MRHILISLAGPRLVSSYALTQLQHHLLAKVTKRNTDDKDVCPLNSYLQEEQDSTYLNPYLKNNWKSRTLTLIF